MDTMKAYIAPIARMTLTSRISLMIPIGLCVIQILTIVQNPGSISYHSRATVATSETPPEQRGTFVPHPNHPPLFTKGSGTR